MTEKPSHLAVDAAFKLRRLASEAAFKILELAELRKCHFPKVRGQGDEKDPPNSWCQMITLPHVRTYHKRDTSNITRILPQYNRISESLVKGFFSTVSLCQ
jgi:hypothetical protein